IVSWNTRDLLVRCIQTFVEDAELADLTVEIIVVDNASSDGTQDTVRNNYPEITLLAQEHNLGFAAANNLGIERGRGRHLLILNPDTELHPGALKHLWNALHAAPHVGLVAPVLLNSDSSFQSAGFAFPGLVQTMLDLYPLHPRLVGSSLNGRYGQGDGLSPFRIDHPLGACMLVRREVIEDVGGFDPGYFVYSEEIDLCRRIADAGWTILCAPGSRVVHHGGQSTGQVADRMQPQLHRSRSRYLRAYHSERFHRMLGILMSAGVMMKRLGVPIPSGGRSADELQEIASYYRDGGSEREHA
ncbi:MAG: glycosyltransferase family 2 protein, partial [Thermomicrobiaceae bacterium]